MKLGNSKGNNTGKKYFIRGKDDLLPPTDENRAKANVFHQWFTKQCQSLVNFLKSKGSFDDDVFNTTFLRMSEKILFTGQEVKDYRGYFCRAYYTNYIQDKVKENRYCEMGSYEEETPVFHLNLEELERSQTLLENDIFNYVYTNYDLREFELFRMYITLKPAINYDTLAQLTGIKTHAIQRIISKILYDIRRHREFTNRYRQIS